MTAWTANPHPELKKLPAGVNCIDPVDVRNSEGVETLNVDPVIAFINVDTITHYRVSE